MTHFNKSYWRVDAEYQTLQHVHNVSDQAPVGVWIPTIGNPYAYFNTEVEAKNALRKILSDEIERLEAVYWSLL